MAPSQKGDGSTTVHTMKRTGRPFRKPVGRSSVGGSSPSVTQTRGNTTARIPGQQGGRDATDASTLSPVLSDILRPSAATAIATTSSAASTQAPPALKKSLSSSSRISALQLEWEKNKQLAQLFDEDSHDSDSSLPPVGGLFRNSQASAKGSQKQPVAASQGLGNASDSTKRQQQTKGGISMTPVPLPRNIAEMQQSGGGPFKGSRKSSGKESSVESQMDSSTSTPHITEESVMKQMETVTNLSTKKAKKSKGKKGEPARNVLSPIHPASTPAMLVELAKKEAQKAGFPAWGSGHTSPESRDTDVSLVVSDLVEDEGNGNYSLDEMRDKDRQGISYSLDDIRKVRPDMPYPENEMLDMDRQGRSYYLYKDVKGKHHRTNAAPLSPGYWHLQNDPKMGFICPLRDCRLMVPSLRSMSSHFHKHKCCLLNDNGDGTFSVTGKYTSKEGPSPAVVMSQNDLPEGAPSPVSPELSTANKKLVSERRVSRAIKATVLPTKSGSSKRRRSPGTNAESDTEEAASKRPKVTPVPVPVMSASTTQLPSQHKTTPSQAVLKYLHGLLSSEQSVPGRADIRELTKLKQVRKLPSAWIQHHKGKILDANTYASALAYIVGDEVMGSKACKRFKGSSRLSEVCVVLPPSLSDEAKHMFSKKPACVSCRYHCHCHRQKLECAWLSENGQQEEKNEGSEQTLNSESNASSSSEESSESESMMDQNSEDEDDVEESGSSWKVGSSTREADLPPKTMPEERQEPRSNAVSPSTSPTPSGSLENNQAATVAAPIATTAQFSASDLEMEDWEFAPGTIRDKQTNENIGFSNAYMTSGQPLTISPDVGFNVIVLKAGARHVLPAQDNQIRSCSVGSGKISVNMKSEQAFKLGVNGVFVLRPGQSCTLENRLYIDAVIHCTTIHNYELQTGGA